MLGGSGREPPPPRPEQPAVPVHTPASGGHVVHLSEGLRPHGSP